MVKYRVELGLYEFKGFRCMEFKDFAVLKVIPIGVGRLKLSGVVYDEKKKKRVIERKDLEILKSYRFDNMWDYISVCKHDKKGALIYIIEGSGFVVKKRKNEKIISKYMNGLIGGKR